MAQQRATRRSHEDLSSQRSPVEGERRLEEIRERFGRITGGLGNYARRYSDEAGEWLDRNSRSVAVVTTFVALGALGFFVYRYVQRRSGNYVG
jgi:hypothetical protein